MKSSLKLGSLVLKSNIILAPLESVSDVGFRQLCHQQGAALTFTEMIRGRGVAKNNKATLDLMDTFDPLTPTGIQLLVTSGAQLQLALKKIEDLAATTRPHFKNIQVVDLNFGCPSRDIVNVGAGPAMLKRTSKMREIFTTLVAWKQTTTLPNIKAVGAKIRLGLNAIEQEQQKVHLQVAELANQAGMDYLTVHARHGAQRSRDPASWDAIREVKQVAQMPIIGNGDVWSAADLQRLLASTGCDGVMVARAAIASPWVFRALGGKQQGSLPSLVELAAAEKDYADWAGRSHTKSKYSAFHSENFARLRRLAQETSLSEGEADKQLQELALPKNRHLQ